jgi:hypothetical protein
LIDFVTGSAVDLTAGSFTLGNAPAGFDYGFTVTSDAVELDVTTSTVPEPSTWALFAGLGVLGLVLFRRSRRDY